MQVEASELLDGRVARRLENRARIIDALFALILEGVPHPTLREVAERAGVTPRTLLNHFPDTEALHAAANTRARELAVKRLPMVQPGQPDIDARVREWFKRAAEYYDGYAAIRWAALTFPGEPKQLDRKRHDRASLNLLERRVLELLGMPEKDPERDPEFARAVRATIDPVMWRLLRMHHGLSRTDAAGVMARNVLGLSRDPSAPRPR